MIIKKIQGNIFEHKHTDIIFAINTEGINDAGFANKIFKQYWPEMTISGPQPLGTLKSKNTPIGMLHALVCHSLLDNTWKQAPSIIKSTLNKLGTAYNENTIISCVLMGAGPIGLSQGADIQAILQAIEESTTKVNVYSIDPIP